MVDALHALPPFVRPANAGSQAPLTGFSAAYLVPVIYVMSVLLFVVDLLRADVLAFGLFYTPMVSTGLFYKRRSSVWILSALAVGMVMIGALSPTVPSDMTSLIVNRTLSVLAIIATAVFVQYAHNVQNRLSAQARRIETAERVKSEILSSLSQEMRMPLHGLLSILGLMVPTCRSDQREALTRVRDGARHLLQTLTNIIDLTELDGRQLARQPIDLRSVGRRAIDQAQAAARERQITLQPLEDGDPLLAQADLWATHRILENLLTHAIATTAPGGMVSLVLDRAPGVVIAAVSEDAHDLRHTLAGDQMMMMEGMRSGILGTGMILVCRLAAAMGGNVATKDQLAARALLQVSLPAAVG